MSDFNTALITMLSELESSGDVTDYEDLYSKISIDMNMYAEHLVDSLYGKSLPAPIIPVLKN